MRIWWQTVDPVAPRKVPAFGNRIQICWKSSSSYEFWRYPPQC